MGTRVGVTSEVSYPEEKVLNLPLLPLFTSDILTGALTPAKSQNYDYHHTFHTNLHQSLSYIRFQDAYNVQRMSCLSLSAAA